VKLFRISAQMSVAFQAGAGICNSSLRRSTAAVMLGICSSIKAVRWNLSCHGLWRRGFAFSVALTTTVPDRHWSRLQMARARSSGHPGPGAGNGGWPTISKMVSRATLLNGGVTLPLTGMMVGNGPGRGRGVPSPAGSHDAHASRLNR